MIDRIVGLIFLPLSILLFLNIFGVTKIHSILGINILIFAAIALILIQIANIMGAHWAKEHIKKSYVLCFIATLPSFIYFFSLGMTLPATLTNSFEPIFASFIFVEGIYSFYW